VNERTAVLLGACAGAVLGAACGYLFFTERGRVLRDELVPRVADLVDELQRAKGTAARAKAAFSSAATAPGPAGRV
jgi:gas vesicle protein